MAREMVSKSPDMPEKILEQIPDEKQKEISQRMTAHRKPVRLVQLTLVPIRIHMVCPKTLGLRFCFQYNIVSTLRLIH